MIGGKAAASAKPTALGTLLQSSTYGSTIPTIYGCARSVPLAIWAANLRQGGSSKKWKQGKKSPTTYVENIDMLLGSNPIAGILQIWANQANNYTLQFIRYTTTVAATITIPDPLLYFVCAVTAANTPSVGLPTSDYGMPGTRPYGNLIIPGSSGSAGFVEDNSVLNAGPTSPFTVGATASGPDWGIYLRASDGFRTVSGVDTPPSGYTNIAGWTAGAAFYAAAGSSPPGANSATSSITVTGGVPTFYALAQLFVLFKSNGGGAPTFTLVCGGPSGGLSDGMGMGLGTATLSGNVAFIAILGGADIKNYATITDNHNNVWQPFPVPRYQQFSTSDGAYHGASIQLYMCANPVPASDYSFIFNSLGGGSSVICGDVISACYEVSQAVPSAPTEMPFWNVVQQGPDLTDPMISKWWPFLYKWAPGDGGTILLPTVTTNGPAWAGASDVNIYYAQLTPVTKNKSPLAYNNMIFEPQLGDGTEYLDAHLPSQQIIYPYYAGVESSKMDLGSTGAIPSWRMEVMGSYAMVPPRDAMFQDMIEDIFKSGMIQTGAALGQIQRGINCNELPGVVQKVPFRQSAAMGTVVSTFYQPNVAGSILVAFARWDATSGTPTISDDAGNVWFALTGGSVGPGYGMWWAKAIAHAAGNKVTISANGSPTTNLRSYIMEIDPGFNAQDNWNSASGTTTAGGTISCSIVTSGDVDYILAMCYFKTDPGLTIPPHWTDVFAPELTPNQSALYFSGRVSLVLKRITRGGQRVGPPTYTLTIPTATGGVPWVIGMFAVNSGLYGTASQPVAYYPKTLFNILEPSSLMQSRLQCLAGGLQGSLTMDSQKAASEWLKDLYIAADTAPVWSGFSLKSIPRSEVSQAGAGVVYVAPTSSGPVANLTESDLIGDPSGPLITVTRKAQADALNILQVQHVDRNNQYNQATTSQPDAGSVALYGPRKQQPIVLNMVVDPTVARRILGIEVRRQTYLRNTYKFKMKGKWLILEAMDLITITDSKIGINQLAVRLTSVVENDQYELECEAEPFTYACNAPDPTLASTVIVPFVPNTNTTVAPVNPPVFLEPPLAMVNNALELWIGVSDPDPNYGGCIVNISTDGGTTYSALNPSIAGSAVTGIIAPWPAGSDPDTVNNLSVNLTESLGTLLSYSVADMNNFVYPSYVSGTTTCGYELMTYSTATLTSANNYTLPASPNGLRRAVYHQPLTGPVNHAGGSRFMFLGPASVAGGIGGGTNSTSNGILKIPLQTSYIGTTLYFKFQTFNKNGSGLQDITTCVAYPYTPAGCATTPSGQIVTITATSTAPGAFSVPHHLTFTPVLGIVQMKTSGNMWVTSVDATNVNLIATDTGLTALVTLFSSPADASPALTPGAPGNFNVTHGLASTPVLVIPQKTGVGDIWKQTPVADATKLYFTASDAGVTGTGYAWLVAPTTAGLPRFAKVTFTSTAGNFTVAHGLTFTPLLVIVRLAASGAVWLQTPFADATNLYLTGSDTGLAGEAEVWG